MLFIVNFKIVFSQSVFDFRHSPVAYSLVFIFIYYYFGFDSCLVVGLLGVNEW